MEREREKRSHEAVVVRGEGDSSGVSCPQRKRTARGGRDARVGEDLIWGETEALADNIDKLAYGELLRHKVPGGYKK